jgi:ketosteroid isomerase-like protein
VFAFHGRKGQVAVTQRQKWSIVWKKQAEGAWKCAFMTLDSDSGAATRPEG